MTYPRAWIVLWAIGLTTVASSQDLSDSSFASAFARAKPCVLALTVSGTKDGADTSPANGTGFLFSSAGQVRLLTAAHVVGNDEQYDRDPQSAGSSSVKRNVRINYLDLNRSSVVHRARTHDSFDVAEVYLDQLSDLRGLKLVRERPKIGKTLLVVSAAPGATLPTPSATRVIPSAADDGPLLRLDREFLEGESGSPVIDERGFVVALIVTRSEPEGRRPYTLALPISEIAGWFPGSATASRAQIDSQADELANEFVKVRTELNRSLLMNEEFVFPAFDRYMSDPTPENWSRVRRTVADSLKIVQRGIDLSIEYDARLIPNAEGAENDLRQASEVVGRRFAAVRKEWRERGETKEKILDGEDLPSRQQAEQWLRDLNRHYQRLAVHLDKMTAELRSASR